MKSKKKTSETTCTTRAIRMVDVVVIVVLLLSFLSSFLGCCLVPGVYFSPPISGYLFCFVLTKMCLLRIMNSIESTVLNTYDSNLIHWRKLKILFGHRILIFALNRWSIFYDLRLLLSLFSFQFYICKGNSIFGDSRWKVFSLVVYLRSILR